MMSKIPTFSETLDEYRDQPDSFDGLEEQREVTLTAGCDIPPEPVEWLWKGFVAIGKLNLLAGMAGVGKTTIAINIAATVTTGGLFPDGTTTEAGNVVMWSGEDDPADTLIPRFMACGADMSRVFIVTGAKLGGKKQPFNPAKDIELLARKMQEIGDAKLLILDPIISVVSGDGNAAIDVRKGLYAVTDLAVSCRCAALGITHFAKGSKNKDMLDRVIGSQAYGAVARLVMAAGKSIDKGPEGEDLSVFGSIKGNIAKHAGGFLYQLESVEPLPSIETSRIMWGSHFEGSVDEKMEGPSGKDGAAESSAVSEAKDFLLKELGGGVTPSNKLKARAGEHGISWASLKRAAKELMVIMKPTNDPVTGTQSWYWKLPTPLH